MEEEKSIEVVGLPEGVTEEKLKNLFENEQRSGGGTIANIKLASNKAQIKFEDNGVAKRVLQRGSILWRKSDLTVRELPNITTAECKTVVVTGFNEDADDELIELYFSNKDRSGGGKIQHLIYEESTKTATITYGSAEVATRVAQNSNHVLEEAELIIRLETEEDCDGSCKLAVVITNVDLENDDEDALDDLKLYFENQRNGGGRIENCIVKGGKVQITFSEERFQRQVLEREHTYEGKKLRLEAFKNRDTSNQLRHKTDDKSKGGQSGWVIVTPLNKKARKLMEDEEEFNNIFSDKDTSGGGEIKELSIIPPAKSLIKYQNASDASEVVNRGSLTVEGCKFELAFQDTPTSVEHSNSCTNPTGVEVSWDKNTETDIRKEMIRMLFENKQRINGGKIKVFNFNPIEGKASITFVDPLVAEAVLKKAEEENLFHYGAQLTVQPLFREVVLNSRAVEVTNLSHDKITKGKQFLTIFFENLSEQGIRDVHWDEEKGRVVFTFDSMEGAERVLNAKSHEIEGEQLQVRMMAPEPPLPPPEGDVDPGRLVISCIPENADSNSLGQFIQPFSTSEIKNISFCLRPGVAEVEFYSQTDFEEIAKKLELLPFLGRMLRVQQVEIPERIQVHRVKNIARHFLELYFENSDQSGGGALIKNDKLEIMADCAIYRFVDRKVLPEVLSKKHKIEDRDGKPVFLYVRPFIKCIGLIPPDFDPSKPRNEKDARIKTNCTDDGSKDLKVHQRVKASTSVGAEKRVGDRFSRVSIPLKPWQKRLLIKENYAQHITKEFPDEVAVFDEAQIILEGPYSKEAQEDILTLLPNIISKMISLTKGLSQLLKKNDCQLLEKLLEDMPIVYDMVDDSIKVFGYKEVECSKAIEKIKNQYKSITINLDREQQEFLRQNTAKKTMIELQEANKVDTIIDDTERGCILISSTAANAKDMELRIKKFLTDNKDIKKVINVPKIIGALLKSPDIVAKLDEIKFNTNLKIVLKDENDKTTIEIKGINLDVKEASTKLDAMLTKIVCRDLPINQGKVNLLKTLEGKSFAECLLLNESAVLEPLCAPPTPKWEYSSSGASMSDQTQKISARLGALSTCCAEAIIHAYSEKSPESNEILEKAGKSIKEDVKNFFRKRREEDMPIHRTGPGKITCMALFHVQMPDRSRHQDKKEDIVDLVSTCLREASRRKYRSIALPMIGLNFSHQERADATIEGIHRFLKRGRSTLEEIVVLSKDPISVRAVKCLMEKSERGAEQEKQNKCKFSMPDKDTLVTPSNLKLQLYKGKLSDHQSDVLLNITNRDLRLEDGFVSKSILNTAGDEIQKECDTHGKIRHGDIAVTKGYRLPCKHVFHGSCPNWNNQKFCDEMLRKLMKTCLRVADEKQCAIIAFPAIGAGRTGVPPKEMAEIMVNEVLDVNLNFAWLKEIHFVIHHRDRHSHLALAEQFQKYCCSKETLTPEQDTSESDDNDEDAGEDDYSGPVARIYATSEKNNQKAHDRVMTFLKDMYHEELLGDDDLVEALRKMSHDDLVFIQEMQHRYKVVVTKLPDFTLRLQGGRSDVETAKTKLENVVMKFNLNRTKTAGDKQKNKVKWYYQQAAGWKAYDEPLSDDIEHAFQKGEPEFAWNEEGSEFALKFDSKSEISDDSKCSVIRREIEPLDTLPSHWSAFDDGEPLKIVPVTIDEDEYQDVMTKITETHGELEMQDIMINRIQNKRLYKMHKMFVENRLEEDPSLSDSVMNLFHGTSSIAVDSINRRGLDRGHRGRNAVKYGDGCYFARDFYFSHHYAEADGSGRRSVYMCRVFVGRTGQGQEGIKEPPRDAQGHYCDVAVDKLDKPAVFVVFQDSQAYPEYLITYRQVEDEFEEAPMDDEV